MLAVDLVCNRFTLLRSPGAVRIEPVYFGTSNNTTMTKSDIGSESDSDLRFRKMADRFIDNANRQLSDTEPSTVNSAFLYGASRFSAFVTVQKAGSLVKFDEIHDEAVNYYTEEFKKMLVQNLEQYRNALERDA